MVIFNRRVVTLVADELKFEKFFGILIREYNYNCIKQFERKQAQITCLSAKHAIEMQL